MGALGFGANLLETMNGGGGATRSSGAGSPAGGGNILESLVHGILPSTSTSGKTAGTGWTPPAADTGNGYQARFASYTPQSPSATPAAAVSQAPADIPLGALPGPGGGGTLSVTYDQRGAW